MIFIRNNEKLNHTSWWDKMYATHLENGRFSILHGYECIVRLLESIIGNLCCKQKDLVGVHSKENDQFYH